MNDPNGMVFHDGEYHLFYQYNPFGDKWGHMSWGHAVSPDMVHWEHLPVALYEENGVMIFSGSAVVDWKNTSGFGRKDEPPLVAIYTGHYTGDRRLQNQHIAFSTDRGRTWTKYADNPVLDIGKADFRDPKVRWHEQTSQWVMTVSIPLERKVGFYGSPNLKDWEHLGDFGPAGAVQGIWECPDLILVPVEGNAILDSQSRIRNRKWLLIVNIGGNSVAGGSGCQYFVGDFDGRTFAVEEPSSGGTAAQWVDYAKDFYAAVSWSDVPKSDGRTLWLGWMSNWQYANDVPTSPWRSSMSIPRELSLRLVDGAWRLVQRPVKEMAGLRQPNKRSFEFKDLTDSVSFSSAREDGIQTYELKAELTPSDNAVLRFDLCKGKEERTTLRFDIRNREMSLDRTRSGIVEFSEHFPGTYRAPIRLIDGRLKLHVFVDTSSIEVFVSDGETVMTSLVLPDPESTGLELAVEKGVLNTSNFDLWELGSAWR